MASRISADCKRINWARTPSSSRTPFSSDRRAVVLAVTMGVVVMSLMMAGTAEGADRNGVRAVGIFDVETRDWDTNYQMNNNMIYLAWHMYDANDIKLMDPYRDIN